MVEKEHCEHTKPHANTGTISHVDHRETTLTTAIVRVLTAKGLARAGDCADVDAAPGEGECGITINTIRIEYEAEKCRYARTDAPEHASYVKNMITGAV